MDYQSRRYALLNTPIEVDRHLQRVHRYLQPRRTDRILEIGCGRGFLTEKVQRFAPETVGIDLNAEAVANAVTSGLRVMDARSLDFPDESFDGIYSFHAIEHIPDLDRVFREIERVLKPGGSAFLLYPAEPVRGLYVVPTAMMLFGNPLRARDIHIHKLSPWKLRRHYRGTSLRSRGSTLHLLYTPQFSTLLHKPERVSRRAARVAEPPLLAARG